MSAAPPNTGEGIFDDAAGRSSILCALGVLICSLSLLRAQIRPLGNQAVGIHTAARNDAAIVSPFWHACMNVILILPGTRHVALLPTLLGASYWWVP